MSETERKHAYMHIHPPHRRNKKGQMDGGKTWGKNKHTEIGMKCDRVRLKLWEKLSKVSDNILTRTALSES